jgi:RNA polymerase sigma-70 factor (ECF subfamily)
VEETTTKDLILQLQAGDVEALGDLYDRFNQMVYRTAYAITGEPEAASDLLQEVYLRLHRFAHRVDPSRPLEPWLYRVTANLSCTWVKRRRWMRPIEEIAEWFVNDSKPSPAKLAERAEVWRQIEHALGSIPLLQRTVIVMYYINELSIQEISDVLEVPVGTIKSRLHYGRQALKKLMTKEQNVMPEVQYEFT